MATKLQTKDFLAYAEIGVLQMCELYEGYVKEEKDPVVRQGYKKTLQSFQSDRDAIEKSIRDFMNALD